MARGSTVAGSKSVVVIGLATGLAAGCMLDPHAGHRPARFHAGPNTRAVSVAPTDDGSPRGNTASRGVIPPEAAPHVSATSVSMQFTMAMPYWIYTGVEAETGRLSTAGSNFAGAYAIVGLHQELPLGGLGAELAAGWQGIRYERGGDQHDSLVLEPRLRAQLWIAEQWTLGASVGARLGHEREGDWMAGAYLGVHSQRF